MVQGGDGPDPGPIDNSVFAERRAARDIVDRLLDDNSWLAPEFEAAVSKLENQRAFALRHLLKRLRTAAQLDDLLTLDLLARLVDPDDSERLAEIANDTSAPQPARVACTLVLLGQDRTDLIRDTRLSGMVLQWQAEYLAEEPSLRHRLMQLYIHGPRDQRASWIALQDRSVKDPTGRAAVFEMLLEVETDVELRRFLIESLSKVGDATTLAALARVRAHDEEEDKLLNARRVQARATLPPSDHRGWKASAGFCDAAGCFSLRFERDGDRRRARRVTLVLDVQRGVREALTLTGPEMAQLQASDVAEQESNGLGGTSFPVPLGEAVGLLREAETATGFDPDRLPSDYETALRLLDPLADIEPRTVSVRAMDDVTRGARETSTLLDHPGYNGWCYDAGNRVLDELRLEFLARSSPRKGPSQEMIGRAVERLERAGEPRRLRAMLLHNAYVHKLAGEVEEYEMADSAARIIAHGGFGELSLVQAMVRRSLHPAFYFLSPYPALPNRSDIAQLVVAGKRPTKGRVLAVDLGLALARAMDVWLSRVPAAERPDAGTLHRAMVELARAGARIAPETQESELETALAETYSECLAVLQFPDTRADPAHEELLSFLVDASTFLIGEICSNCPQRCLHAPREDGARALDSASFPAGPQAESRIRGWPGRFLHRPAPELSSKLEAFIHPDLDSRQDQDEVERKVAEQPGFTCGLCEQQRPMTARSRTQFQRHEATEPQRICRRCQGRVRKDAAFRAQLARLGQLNEPGN